MPPLIAGGAVVNEESAVTWSRQNGIRRLEAVRRQSSPSAGQCHFSEHFRLQAF